MQNHSKFELKPFYKAGTDHDIRNDDVIEGVAVQLCLEKKIS